MTPTGATGNADGACKFTVMFLSSCLECEKGDYPWSTMMKQEKAEKESNNSADQTMLVSPPPP